MYHYAKIKIDIYNMSKLTIIAMCYGRTGRRIDQPKLWNSFALKKAFVSTP